MIENIKMLILYQNISDIVFLVVGHKHAITECNIFYKLSCAYILDI